MTKIKTSGLLTALLLFFVVFFNAYSEEICLKNAWEKFNQKKYEKTIEFCNQCIEEFGEDAHEKQKKLEKTKIPNPPVGKVSDAEKNAIFARGSLNDVATAYWMKGRSAEYIYKKNGQQRYKSMVEEAYREACVLRYGRTWDSRGWFWSPCEASEERLPID